MQISQRVCAILLTPENELLLVRNTRYGSVPYWTAPACIVQETDLSLEAALTRELDTLIMQPVHIIKPVFTTEHILEEDVVVRQWFYLCFLADRPVKPKSRASTRALLDPSLEKIQPTPDALKRLNIQPERLKAFLITNCDRLPSLPAVR